MIRSPQPFHTHGIFTYHLLLQWQVVISRFVWFLTCVHPRSTSYINDGSYYLLLSSYMVIRRVSEQNLIEVVERVCAFIHSMKSVIREKISFDRKN